MSRRFEGKVVVVTAAAAGIGAATAEAFAEEGARVMLADIDRERGEAASRLDGERPCAAGGWRLDCAGLGTL